MSNPLGGAVLLLDNRPGGLNLYHRRIRGFLPSLEHLEGGIIPVDLPFASVPDQTLTDTIIDGVRHGRFRDKDKIRQWIRVVNKWAHWGSCGLEDLSLVHAHAETHIDEVFARIVNEGMRPAALVLSGSSKMLGEGSVLNSPVIQKTLALIAYCLDHEIPVLGICFGLHLLAYACYGELPTYLTVPDDVGVQYHPHSHGHKFTSVVPGKKLQVYGVERLRAVREGPVTNAMRSGMAALEVHSQYLKPDVFIERGLREAILVLSTPYFRPKATTRKQGQVTQHIVEILRCGPVAFGAQLHPEVDRDLILVLSYVFEEALRKEGHDLWIVRDGLVRYPAESYFVGERVGYNFIKRVVATDYIRAAHVQRNISGSQARVLRRRLEEHNPHLK